MADASLVLDAIVTVSIAAGALFAIVELRAIARDRRTQLVVDIMRHMGTVEFQEQCEKIEKAKFGSGPEAKEKCGDVPLGVVSHINEQIGLLMKMKLVDEVLVHESIGIADAWDRMKPWCLWVRSNTDPDAYEHFESAAASERAYEAEKKRKLAACPI